MSHEDEPSLPESFWNTLRRDDAKERDIDRGYFRFTLSRSLPRPPARIIHWLVFGFVAGVAAVSAAASGRYWILRWLPLVPHESRASSVHPWRHRAPSTDGELSSPPAASSDPDLVKPSPSSTPPPLRSPE
ncbi:MAG TPA: hypothetical protein VGQ57_09395 [Polyangiaceae bacterium]|jgi:hypothetical protein|nr:hypothetical protein [Polyangiaceae bacterium]